MQWYLGTDRLFYNNAISLDKNITKEAVKQDGRIIAISAAVKILNVPHFGTTKKRCHCKLKS